MYYRTISNDYFILSLVANILWYKMHENIKKGEWEFGFYQTASEIQNKTW